MYSVIVYGHPSKADGTVVCRIPRERLRQRKFVTTATVGVTNERRHDAHTTQHFLDDSFKYWLARADLTKFWAWVGHSDNASHFKSGAMLNYWSGKMSEYDFIKACWVQFGCPGHGKGPWDGLGAVLKQQVTRDITNGKALTESGYITCPKEVAEHLAARFASEEWKRAHADKGINEIVVFYAEHSEIARPRADQAFDALDGARSSFSYLMLGQDQIARRSRSCWCEGCARAFGRANMRSEGDSLICEGCTYRYALPWSQQTIRPLGAGLAQRRKDAQVEGKKLALKLVAPSSLKPLDGFLAIQARERWSRSEEVHYRPGHFWLAQAPLPLSSPLLLMA